MLLASAPLPSLRTSKTTRIVFSFEELKGAATDASLELSDI